MESFSKIYTDIPAPRSTQRARDSSTPSIQFQTFSPNFLAALDGSIDRARSALLDLQKPDGFWVGELEGDSILESEYILLRFILKQDDDPQLPLIGNHLRQLQQSHGGWSLYPGGGPDLSGTVKAYFALKLLGDSPDAPHMRLARQVVLKLGGAERCNSFSKFFLAALGQIPYSACPTVPPEVILLPRWSYFNLYAVSAWTRTMIMPLAITTTFQPVRELDVSQGIRELFAGDPADCPVLYSTEPPRGWRRFFLGIDDLLKIYHRHPLQPLRDISLRKAERWLLEHLEHSDGLGAIFPPMVYIHVALRALGYREDDLHLVRADEHLRGLQIAEEDSIRLQPCHSVIWDTSLVLCALAESGLPAHSNAAQHAVRWLLSKECRNKGDWRMTCHYPKPAGWFFEFSNPHYPDVDDTAMVAMGIKRCWPMLDQSTREQAEPALDRAIGWLLAMQNDDGGWAAFDRTRSRPILEQIPFADHNAMQDPSCADITGRVLECFGYFDFAPDHPVVRKAISFLTASQESDGSWRGRWGVNYVYGTWQVLVGLKSIDASMDRPFIRSAADWLASCQKPDGSWGESCDSYEDPSLKGLGPATASQTAWGMMGLLAAHGPTDPAIAHAAQWLIDHQASDGAWDESWFTGTGFPKVFYLKYHLYRHYFPLMALSRLHRRLRRH